jgi:hypothetical protein
MLKCIFVLLLAVNITSLTIAASSRCNVGQSRSFGRRSAMVLKSSTASIDIPASIDIRGGKQSGGLLSRTIQGLKERSAYDSKFTTKLSVELCVGFVTQLIAEYAKRGAQTMNEFDFVIADLIMGLSANFFAVYLSAPVATKAPSAVKESKWEAFLSGCPDNAFQKNSPGGLTYSVPQRIFSMIKVAPKLFVIGFIAMALGTVFTTILALARTLIQNGGKVAGFGLFNKAAIDGLIELFKTSTAIGLYLAVSTNLRYQVVAGILEGRIIDPLFSKYPAAQALGSFFVRTANTYIGAALMVDFLKIIAGL